MDEADRAQQNTELALELALRNRPRSPALPYTGNCAWCDAPVGPKQRFCDRDCADDWETHERRKGERHA